MTRKERRAAWREQGGEWKGTAPVIRTPFECGEVMYPKHSVASRGRWSREGWEQTKEQAANHLSAAEAKRDRKRFFGVST